MTTLFSRRSERLVIHQYGLSGHVSCGDKQKAGKSQSNLDKTLGFRYEDASSTAENALRAASLTVSTVVSSEQR